MMTQLFEVQTEALRWSNGRTKWGHFLEQGLGKTLVTLTEFNDLYKAGKVDVAVIVCPNSLITVWKNEIKKHGYQFQAVSKPDSLKKIVPPSVVIYNYESLIANAGRMIPDIMVTHRTYLVFDESVQIKNFKSARWKVIKSWYSNAAYTRLLSGRPMVQSAMDLWTQLTLLGGKVHSSPYAYRNTYCQMGGWMNKVVVGVKNKEDLQEKIADVSFRAAKKDWLDIPDKLYTTREYALSAEQKKKYNEMLKTMVVEMGEDDTISVQHAVHKVQKLQQIGSGIIIDEQGESRQVTPYDDLPKIKVLDEIIEESSGKVIIFANYRASVEALHKWYGGAVIRGGMKEAELVEELEKFNNGPCKVLVAQLAAARYGLTLLGNAADPCSTTVYYENSYSLDARIQSEDRNHRIGQKNSVLYIDLIGTPVDSKIIAALQRKDELSLSLLRDVISGGVNERI